MSLTLHLDQSIKNLTAQLTIHALGWVYSYAITKCEGKPSLLRVGPCIHKDFRRKLSRVYAHTELQSVFSKVVSWMNKCENIRLCVTVQQCNSDCSRYNSKMAPKIPNSCVHTLFNPFSLSVEDM